MDNTKATASDLEAASRSAPHRTKRSISLGLGDFDIRYTTLAGAGGGAEGMLEGTASHRHYSKELRDAPQEWPISIQEWISSALAHTRARLWLRSSQRHIAVQTLLIRL